MENTGQALKREGLVADAPPAARKLWEKICDFDLTQERHITEFRMGHSPEHAREMESEYRKYLFIRFMHKGERLPMSKAVDDFWHAHTLNTRCYGLFCAQVGDGYFLHHKPTTSEAENMALMPRYLEGTLVRLSQYFGKPDARFWPATGDHACCGC